MQKNESSEILMNFDENSIMNAFSTTICPIRQNLKNLSQKNIPFTVKMSIFDDFSLKICKKNKSNQIVMNFA